MGYSVLSKNFPIGCYVISTNVEIRSNSRTLEFTIRQTLTPLLTLCLHVAAIGRTIAICNLPIIRRGWFIYISDGITETLMFRQFPSGVDVSYGIRSPTGRLIAVVGRRSCFA